MVAPGGACMVFGGACMVFSGGCMVFSRGACVFFSRGHACFFLGGMRGFLRGGACVGYDEIRSISGRYASYWNAFLFAKMIKFSVEKKTLKKY